MRIIYRWYIQCRILVSLLDWRFLSSSSRFAISFLCLRTSRLIKCQYFSFSFFSSSSLRRSLTKAHYSRIFRYFSSCLTFLKGFPSRFYSARALRWSVFCCYILSLNFLCFSYSSFIFLRSSLKGSDSGSLS